MTGLWKRERGQALVELAIMLPILLIILLGVIDFGRVFYAYVTITNAAREGARYGSLHPGPVPDPVPAIIEHVVQEASPFLDEDDIVIDVIPCWEYCDPSPDGTITVTVEYDFETLFFGNLPYMPGPIFTISAQTEMPIGPALEE